MDSPEDETVKMAEDEPVDMDDDDTVEMAALGRPFHLGMLYDCRKDALIPGVTLWNHDELQKNAVEHKHQNTEFNVTTSDSLDEKTDSLKVSGALKASVLLGLVKGGGSASYFHDTKKSQKQQRLTLQYKTTTKFEALTMSHLGRGQVSHPNVFLDDTATHVVTAILYGASAYFVFDRESTEDDVKMHMEGELKVVMNKLLVTADASVSMEERRKAEKAVENFNCTFHGDFQLYTNPATFKEAMRVYRQLPKMLGENGEHAVSVRVWLYPLVKLDPSAPRVHISADISNSLVTFTSGVIEDFNKIEMRCNDLLKDTAATTFSSIEKKLQTFMHNGQRYKKEFVQRLGSILPSIRRGKKKGLDDIFKSHENSPFNSAQLDQWLSYKEKESDTLKSFLKQLKDLGVKLNDKLDDLLSDVNTQNIVSFSFTSVDQPDSFLIQQFTSLNPVGQVCNYTESAEQSTTQKDQEHSQSTTQTDQEHSQSTTQTDQEPSQSGNTEWFSANTTKIMRRQLQLFEQLKKQNETEQLLGENKFIVASTYDDRYLGAHIFIYEDGCDRPVPFIPPSKPATPTTSDVSYDRITIGLFEADSATEEYRVDFRMKREAKWTFHLVQKDQEMVTLTELKPDTEYEIRATAVGKLRYAVSSDTVTAVTAKLTMNQPSNVIVTDVKPDCVTLTWRNPSVLQCDYLLTKYQMKQETEWTSQPVQKTRETTLAGLKPDTEYEIKITAVGKLSSDVITVVTAEPVISPPTNVAVTQVKADSITLTWSIPEQCGPVKQYIIEFNNVDSSEWQKEETQQEVYTFTLKNLKPNTTYSIRMKTDAWYGMSKSEEVLKIKTKEGPLDTGRFTLLPGSPPVYLLNLKSTDQLNMKVCGEASSRNPLNKTIMLVGAIGAGKTTLINAMINYVLGVEWENNWRFKLVEEEASVSKEHSQTSEVTAYQIHHTDEFQIPYSLTIIDTPGFGDSGGIKHDKEITRKIRQFLTIENGIDTIDAVCFVAQATSACLTYAQRYSYEAILSMFGKNIANSIITLITFADGQSPPILDTIKESNVPCATQTNGCPIHFKFNNSGLFVNSARGSSDEEDFDFMFWRAGETSMQRFFRHLGSMETQSLTLTKQVVQEGKRLGETFEEVQLLIQKGLSIMGEIKTTQVALDRYESQIEENKSFEYEVVIQTHERVNVEKGTFTTNCLKCHHSCHYPCTRRNDAGKQHCAVMTDGNCRKCPGECAWNDHWNSTFRWELKREELKGTHQDVKSRFETAIRQKMSTEKIMAELQVEYEQVKDEVAQLMTIVSQCLKCLKDIALRTDPLAAPEYVDLLIQSEEQKVGTGFQRDIRELEEVRETAVPVREEVAHTVANEEYKPEELQTLTT